MTERYTVTSASLNLRSEPAVITPGTAMAILQMGNVVTKVEGSSVPKWWKVAAVISGRDVAGYVNSKYLKPIEAFPDPPPLAGISAVHLSSTGRIARNQTAGRAFPLNEASQPSRGGAIPTAKAAELSKIIKWLAVESNARYARANGATFCNIYAYDYCFLANVYLPRVWWTRKALVKLATGETVVPKYDMTVSELNANSLYNWFEEFSDDFGWARIFDLTEAQEAANAGQVVIICAQRKDLNRSGHICPVVPETAQHQAKRQGGQVTMPLQSQAGASNFSYGTGRWWPGAQFRAFGFWKHD